MKTKLQQIIDGYGIKLKQLYQLIDNKSNSYDFETQFTEIHKEVGHDIFQELVGTIPKSKNDKITILTSFGKIDFPKTHPLAVAPGGFKISPYL